MGLKDILTQYWNVDQREHGVDRTGDFQFPDKGLQSTSDLYCLLLDLNDLVLAEEKLILINLHTLQAYNCLNGADFEKRILSAVR